MRKTKKLNSNPNKGIHNRKPKGEAGLQKLYMHYIWGAKHRKRKFELTREEFKILTKSNCFYCNSAPSTSITTTCTNATSEGKLHAMYTYNGIDRINNDLGYFLENCVTCCKICNSMKGKLSIIEFKDWINKIYKHWGDK